MQLIYRQLIRNKSRLSRFLFGLGVVSVVITAWLFSIQYKEAQQAMVRFKKSNYTVLEKNFMTEKILGMYFKYHTRICEYDGWRPPLHEPALVIGQWFNGRLDPLSPDGETWLDLRERVELYRRFFPELPVKLDCSCATYYSSDYHHDLLFYKAE